MSDFWARRKAAVAQEAETDAAEALAAETAQEEAALAERTDEEILAELNLPQPEALESAEAVRDFVAQAIPQRLKTRALRHLWKLNPVLANLDGLVDYGEDFTDSAAVMENLQTAYQVGKGMLAHLEEKAAADEPSEASGHQEECDETEADDVPVTAEVEAAQGPEPAQAPSEIAVAETMSAPLASRRMQFRFEESV